MRVFIIHPSHLLTDWRPHGDGLVAFGFIAELARRGHRLEVATEAVDLRAPLPSNVRLHAIGSARGPIGRLRYAYNVRRLFQRLVRDEPFDVAHQLNPVFAGLSLGLIGCKVPIVLGTYVGAWPTARHTRLQVVTKAIVRVARGRVERLQRAKASALLVTTPAAAARFSPNATDARKTRVLANGVDVVALRPAPRRGMRIVALCGLAFKKGAWDLIDAFARIAETYPEATLEIGGSADDDAVTRVRSQYPAITSRVVFHGTIERDRLASFLGGARVFAMPSHGEPYGMAALEAMACALPIVATRSGGLRYLVSESTDGRLGNVLVDVADRRGLARALARFLADAAEAERVGAQNRDEVVAHYSWRHVVDRLESIYATVSSRDAFPERGIKT